MQTLRPRLARKGRLTNNVPGVQDEAIQAPTDMGEYVRDCSDGRTLEAAEGW